MILVECPWHKWFRAFLEDPGHADLHPLRENGVCNYLWWMYERLQDLRSCWPKEPAEEVERPIANTISFRLRTR